MIIGKFPRKSPSIWKLCISKQLTDKIGVIKHFLKTTKPKHLLRRKGLALNIPVLEKKFPITDPTIHHKKLEKEKKINPKVRGRNKM